MKTQKWLIFLLSIGMVTCGAVTVWALFFQNQDAALIPDYAPQEMEGNVQPVSDDGSKLDVPANGGGISIEYASEVTVNLSDGKAYLNYTHPARSVQNIVLRIEVQDTVIAQSGTIKPGYQLKEMDLFDDAAKKLQAGTYNNAIFRILSYDPETGEKAMIDTMAEIVVTVQ